MFAVGRKGGHIHMGNDTIKDHFNTIDKEMDEGDSPTLINVVQPNILDRKDHTLIHMLSDGYSTRQVYDKQFQEILPKP